MHALRHRTHQHHRRLLGQGMLERKAADDLREFCRLHLHVVRRLVEQCIVKRTGPLERTADARNSPFLDILEAFRRCQRRPSLLAHRLTFLCRRQDPCDILRIECQ